MTTPEVKYTDEEVMAAIKAGEAYPDFQPLAWAAGQYLKAKEIIEWYAVWDNYRYSAREDSCGNAEPCPEIADKAIEFLKTEGESR